MTVKELIEELKKYSGELQVWHTDYEQGENEVYCVKQFRIPFSNNETGVLIQ